MKTVYIIVLASVMTVCADEQIDVSIKELTHQVYIQNAAADAVKHAQTLLQNESLSAEEKTQIGELMQTAALRDSTPEVIRTAMKVLSEKKLPHDELRAKISLDVHESYDPSFNKNIKEALKYQWEKHDWENSEIDKNLFFDYLDELVLNTNIAETTRMQANVFRTIINLYINNKDVTGVERHHVKKRLLVKTSG